MNVGSFNEVLISPRGERLLKLISQRKLDLLVVSLPWETGGMTDLECRFISLPFFIRVGF